jgi:hypothetical protein
VLIVVWYVVSRISVAALRVRPDPAVRATAVAEERS